MGSRKNLTLRDVFSDSHFKARVVKEMMTKKVRVLMRETPGDAQFVELTGSMRKNLALSRDPLSFEIHDLPIVVQSMNVPDDDPTEWSSYPTHMLNVAVTDYGTSMSSGAFGSGIGASIKDWEVLGIDDYELEPHDAEMLKAYVASRPELLQHIMDVLSQGVSDYEASIY